MASIKEEILKTLNFLKISGNPSGAIIWYSGTDIPDGYLLCNGAAVPRAKYASLFKAIGTKYGAGDGSTTFTLPNFNGRVPQGTTDTSQVGKALEASLPNISGGVGYLMATNDWTPYGVFHFSGQVTGSPGRNAGGTSAGIDFQAKDSNAVYSGSKVQPSALQLLACIRC